MLKNEQGVSGIDDILSVITSETKPSTKKMYFFIVEEFGRFQKKSAKSREYCKIPGINGLHSTYDTYR